MEYKDAVQYLVQISGGLSVIHHSKIIYRDLKPENVLLTASGDVKLADFGLSKDVSLLDGRTRSACGTYYYMAPEQVRGDSYTFTIDWYALGVLMHKVLTGTIPYDIEYDNPREWTCSSFASASLQSA